MPCLRRGAPARELAATLVTVAALAATPAPAPAPEQAQNGLRVNGLSTLFKVRPGLAGIPDAPPQYHLRAAAGACAAFQLLVRTPALHIEVQAPPLQGPPGRVDLLVLREEFIDLRVPTNGLKAPGLWPDPLVPATGEAGAAYARAHPQDSSPERPLVLYAEACVPPKMASGDLSTTVTVKAHGHGDATVPVSLSIEPFSIPVTSSLESSFGLSLYTMSKGHHLVPASPEAHELLKAYAIELLRHRLSAHGLTQDPPRISKDDKGLLSVDFRAYDAELRPFMDGSVLSSGARFTTAEVRDNRQLIKDADKTSYYEAFSRHFRENRWPQTVFFYAKDEPKPKDWPLVLEQARLIHAAGSGAPKVLVTAAYNDTLGPHTDIFCPLINCFFSRPGLPATCPATKTSEELRARVPFARVWWYQSCMSHGCSNTPSNEPEVREAFSGWASYMVDAPGPLNRAMGPLAFLADVKGELYFDVLSAYSSAPDPWTDVFRFGGNGDGTLFYPGTPERMGESAHHPVVSLRLKAIRDGLTDYEYLKALERVGEASFARDEVGKLVHSGYEITQDPAVWENTRAEVLDHLRAHRSTK
jgi:hypothetical protein